jgi:hypothetical protein
MSEDGIPEFVAQFLYVLLLSALIFAVGIVFAPLGRDKLARWRKR